MIPQTGEGKQAEAPLDIVYLDLTGPEDVPTLGGSTYIMNIIDYYSSFPWGFTLKRKSDEEQIFLDWKMQVEWETGRKVGIVHSDGGGEYSSTSYEAILRRQVEHQTTAPYTSAHNRKSERMHHTIMGRARAMHSDAKLPPNMWGECVMTAFYLAQHTPTQSLNRKMPFEMLYYHKPRVSHLCEYGCRAFVLTQNKVNPKIY